MMRLLLLLVVATLAAVCYGFDPNSYAHSQQLLPRFEVYWNVDEKNEMIYLALHVQTTGWVGFGISEFTSGSMPGSDIIVGSVVDGSASISDLWASEYALPNKDDCQDWILIAAEEVDGYTTIEVARALDTKDAQDRAIVSGPNRVVIAFGENGVDTLSYHSGNRITSEITFFGGSVIPPLPAQTQSFEFRLPNYTVPNGQTNYVCMSLALPTDQEYSIIQIDPIVDQQNIEHVHHFLVYICTNVAGGYVTQFEKPGDCFMGSDDSGCSDILAAWAAGGGSTVLPPDAGFAMGAGDNSAKYLVLQIHFNNPSGVGGFVDNSGVRIWYTNQLRKYAAGVMVTGDPGINFPPIPANAITQYEAECPSICTESMEEDLIIWQSFPHMHQVGSEIWTTQWRDDELINEIGRVEFWSFDHQQAEFVNITVKRGDRLNTHCVYDTTGKDNVTHFGLTSTDEMCMHFLSYYPRIYRPSGEAFSFCGYLTPNITVCGNWDGPDFLNYSNPSVFDPPGGEERTFGMSAPCEPEPTPVPVRPLPPSQPTIAPGNGPTSDPVPTPTRGPKPTSLPAKSGAGIVRASVGALALACFALFLL